MFSNLRNCDCGSAFFKLRNCDCGLKKKSCAAHLWYLVSTFDSLPSAVMMSDFFRRKVRYRYRYFQATGEEVSRQRLPPANNSNSEFGDSFNANGGTLVSGTTSNPAGQPETGAVSREWMTLGEVGKVSEDR